MFMTERLNLIFTQAATIAKSENRLEEKSIRLLEELAKEIATKIALHLIKMNQKSYAWLLIFQMVLL